MIIEIHEADSEKNIVLVCNDKRFVREFGSSTVECRTKGVYQNLRMISDWADNALRESCQFEVK